MEKELLWSEEVEWNEGVVCKCSYTGCRIM